MTYAKLEKHICQKCHQVSEDKLCLEGYCTACGDELECGFCAVCSVQDDSDE